MKTIEIKTQAEFDALPKKYDEYTSVRLNAEIGVLNTTPENCCFEVCGGTIGAIWGGTISAVSGMPELESARTKRK